MHSAYDGYIGRNSRSGTAAEYKSRAALKPASDHVRFRRIGSAFSEGLAGCHFYCMEMFILCVLLTLVAHT